MLATYLAQRPPRRLRRLVLAYMKAHPRLMHSRAGEQVLMRWAREDLIFDAGDEDTLVHGPPPGVRAGAGIDEGIPLKPSPRPMVPNNYGSA